MRTLLVVSGAAAFRGEKNSVDVDNSKKISRLSLQLESLLKRVEFDRFAEIILFFELSGWGEVITTPRQLVSRQTGSVVRNRIRLSGTACLLFVQRMDCPQHFLVARSSRD